MKTNYINFTPAEREQAQATDLAEFLRGQGYDLKREGRGSVWMNGGEKVSVQGNLWYNQYTREGGDAIDFARRFFDCPDYPSAVRLLLGADVGVVVISQQKQEKKEEQKPFALPPANSDMHRIYAYLMKPRTRNCSTKKQPTTIVFLSAMMREGLPAMRTNGGQPPEAALSATRTEAIRNTVSTGWEPPSACLLLKRRLICSLTSRCTRRIGNGTVMSRSVPLRRLRRSR